MNRKSEPGMMHDPLKNTHDQSEHVMDELMRMFDHVFKQDQAASSASERPQYYVSAQSTGQRIAPRNVGKPE